MTNVVAIHGAEPVCSEANQEVINKLNAAVAEAVRSPEIKEQLIRSGYEPETTTPDGFNQLMKEDIVAWGKAVKASGVQID